MQKGLERRVRSKGKGHINHTGGEGGGCRIEGRGGTGAGGWGLAGAGDGETEPKGGGLGGLGMEGGPDRLGINEGGVGGKGGGWRAIRFGWLGGDGGDENGFGRGAGGILLAKNGDLEAWVEKRGAKVGMKAVMRWAQEGVERLGEGAEGGVGGACGLGGGSWNGGGGTGGKGLAAQPEKNEQENCYDALDDTMPEGATRMDRSPQSQKCVECLMPCGYNTPTVCPQPAAVIIRCKLANDEMQACRREFRSKCTLNPLMAMSHLLELTGQTGSGVNIVIAFGLLQGICFFSLGEECRHCFAQQAKRLSDTSRCMCEFTFYYVIGQSDRARQQR
eukprot:1160689-Pelagomonas_calceolata.AAC.5